MDFLNFHPIYVFKVKECTADILTELPCLSDLENPSQLPVWRYWWYCLMNCWNFQTILVFEVRESITDISTELLCISYLENLGQLPVQGYLRRTDNFIWWIFTISYIFTIYVFEVKESIVDILTELFILIKHDRVRWLSLVVPKAADTIPHQRYMI